MKTIKRKIVVIDEERCNGCGECIPNCREGAIAIIDGKAKLVSEQFCDGLGACLGHCPQDAIRIEEKDAEVFSEAAVAAAKSKGHEHAPAGCPSSRAIFLTERLKKSSAKDRSLTIPEDAVSCLANWPVQLKLVAPNASYFTDADLLIAADCVAFSFPDFHRRLLEGKILLIACPKLDDAEFYTEKLAQIFKLNRIKSLTLAHMEVPCCFGLKMIIEDALDKAKSDIKVNEIVVSIEGKIKEG